MTREDWDRLYATQRPPCNAMDTDDPGRPLCALRAGHDGRHNTSLDGNGREFGLTATDHPDDAPRVTRKD